MNLKIAVISDLHCHRKSSNNNIQESYFLTDAVIPDNQNPLESFRHLIKKKNLTADILIMPGDITNKCDQDGFEYGWKIVKEVGSLLGVKFIIPTIGNHDVDSRKLFSSNPFNKIQNFSSDFPFDSELTNKTFWENGFVFFEGANFRVLVINSAYDHQTVAAAEHGNLDQTTLNEIEEQLKKLKAEAKEFNIAICHHHPIPHERHYLGTQDLMFNGTQLVEILGQYGYQMIIHGHKHDPMIRYSSGGANSPIVFSAGSFSAFKSLLLQGAYNTFHIINLDGTEKQDCENQGTVDTWFFTPSKGWDSDVNNEYFLPNIGFGCRTPLSQLAKRVYTWFNNGTIDNYDWNEFVTNFDMINHLLPNDKKKLGENLQGFKINVYPKFPLQPEIISFNRQ
jgi:predicted phosphodiesterase